MQAENEIPLLEFEKLMEYVEEAPDEEATARQFIAALVASASLLMGLLGNVLFHSTPMGINVFLYVGPLSLAAFGLLIYVRRPVVSKHAVFAIPAAAFFMHGWYPETINSVVPGGWTIAVEMTFYIFLPYLFRRLTSIKSTLIALLLALIFSRLISIFAGLIISPYYPENQHYLVAGFKFFWFFSQFPVFIWGILVFHLINKYPHCDKKTALFMLFSAIYLLLAFMHVDTYFSLIPHHVLYGLFFALFSLSLHYSPQIFFVNRVTVLLGKLSFSIYLVHFMVLKEFKKIFSDGFLLDGNIGFITAFIFVLAVSVCISYVTHRAIEIPGINLGKFIIKKL